MTRKIWIASGLLALTAVVLGACSGGHSSSSPTPVTTLRLEDNFGTQFGVDFRASPDSEPVKPTSGDLTPVDLSAEPRALR